MKRLIALAVVLVGAQAAFADIGIYSATMTGAEEVPPVVTDAFGGASFTFDSDTGALVGSMFAQDMSSGFTGSHIHLAPAGSEAGVFLDLGSPTIDGSLWTWDLDLVVPALDRTTLKTAMDTGGAYINIHSDNFPEGEIRGQIQVVPEPGTVAVLSLGALALLRRRRRPA